MKTSLRTFRKGGDIPIQKATTTKLNIDAAIMRQLFKAVVKASDEINEKSFQVFLWTSQAFTANLAAGASVGVLRAEWF